MPSFVDNTPFVSTPPPPKRSKLLPSMSSPSPPAPSPKTPRDVCLVGVARTPIGSFQGKLASLSAPELAGLAIRAAVARAGVSPADIEEVILGHVLGAGVGQSPAKQAAVRAGLPHSVPCSSVNKVCASGMKALMLASQSIMLGLRDVVVVGGMESMSQAPHLSAKARSGARFGELVFSDAIQTDGLFDAFDKIPMGDLAEACATEYGISREAQDAYAAESYRRARQATRDGKFQSEIVPVEIQTRKETLRVTEDEEAVAREIDAAALAKLRTCFTAPPGSAASVTPGNASPINDGAAAIVLMSRAKAQSLGLGDKILAVVRGFGDAEQEAARFTTSPALAIPKALAHAQLELSQVDFFEVNEAFSVVALANARLLGLPDTNRVNVYGGAVALGHPLGCSGARILVTLSSVLAQEGGRFGCAAVCNGGGGASAVVLERE